ncbi:MAG: restriction endonuclease subunit S [Cyclobacteriaceae bacterium]
MIVKDIILSHKQGFYKPGKQKPGNVHFVRISDINNNSYLNKETTPMIEAENSEIEKFDIKKGDFLFARTGGAGRFCLIQDDIYGVFASYLIRFRFNDQNDKDFLRYFFMSDAFQNELKSKIHGGVNQNVHAENIKDCTVPEVPFPEQRQIVAILDQAFAAIDQAKANIEKNIQNAKDLFQSKLNEIFSQKGDGWEEKTLKEITSKIGSGATPRGGQASYKEYGISLIRSMNVHDDGFREEKLAFIDEEQAGKLNNVTIQEKDVLLNITGASVARCCVVDSKFLPARVNQHVSIIRIKDDILNEQFLHFALTSKTTKDLLLGIGEQGATRQAITKAQIESFKIAFPKAPQEQNRLVISLNHIKKESESLQKTYQEKVQALAELKKSILQKAFAGELTKKM